MQVRGTADTKEALKSYWTTLGVVSALLLSVSYSVSDDAWKQGLESLSDLGEQERPLGCPWSQLILSSQLGLVNR